MPIKYVSLFSGIEAASVAWADLDFEPVAFAEIEPFPCAVLEYRFPDVPNLGDVTTIDWKEFQKEYGAVDLVVGGSPCQSFSVAGGRTGLDGESGLMWEYLRAVHDLRPRWVLWENVPGVFSIDNGRAFGTLISELQGFGYGVAWRVLDAQFFGVAQRRRRVFVVGCLGEVGSAAAVLFESTSVRGNTQASRDKREALAREVEESPDAAVYSRTERPKQAGGASTFKETGLANTLNTYDLGDKRSNELVVEPAGFKYHNGPKAHGIGYEEGVSPTLVSDWHQPAITEPTLFSGDGLCTI